MAMFVMLTRLSPDALSSPGSLKSLERQTVDQVRSKCPKVDWVENFAVLGGCDYLDIFQAPDIETAMQVSAIVRSFGHATTEIWPVTQWSRFKELIRGLEEG
ncbi:MAG: GYD domain-containing protein [Syntrophotaleaceae bacterium]